MSIINDKFSENYWENCTDKNYAPMMVRGIGRRLEKFELQELSSKFKDRSLRILEVGSGNGEFLKALQNEGFHNIRGVDMNPRHQRKYPELDEIIDTDIIQMRCKPKDEVPFDLVYSHLIFDHDCYRQQRSEGMREAMLSEIHGSLIPEGLYYGVESHQVQVIRDIIWSINPRANTLIGNYDRKFIPADY